MSLKKLKYSVPTDVKIFRNLHSCLKMTAEVHMTDIISVLRYLDESGKYAGIRGLYNSLAKKYYMLHTSKFSGSRKSAEALVGIMPILITGARPREALVKTLARIIADG